MKIINVNYFTLALFTLVSFALASQAGAVCQEGCLENYNTALGEDALLDTAGFQSTAIGFNSLHSNTTGRNTATGAYALYTNTTGTFNTAVGGFALYSNVGGSCCFPGSYNTAIGDSALYSNTTGAVNTAAGNEALSSNTTGSYNTADGGEALLVNRTGSYNTANGQSALRLNSNGFRNTATGYYALLSNTSGSNNIALGYQAGYKLTTGSNNIDIGNVGASNESDKIRIGTTGTHRDTFIAGISGAAVADGVSVIIDARGHLGTLVSSERFKDEIKPMGNASEAVLALKPASFHYKHELDPAGIPQFGLVAEEVEKVNPDLVARDEQGKAYAVRYEAVNAMLLNEFLKEHRKVKNQEAMIAELRMALKEQEKQITTLTSQMQRVSDQFKGSEIGVERVAGNR